MTEAVSRRPLTAETHVRSQASTHEICGRHSGTGTDFSPSTSVFPWQYHSTNASYSSSSTWCRHEKDERAKSGNLHKAVVFMKSGSAGQKRTFSRWWTSRLNRTVPDSRSEGRTHLSVTLLRWGSRLLRRRATNEDMVRPCVSHWQLFRLRLFLSLFGTVTSAACDTDRSLRCRWPCPDTDVSK